MRFVLVTVSPQDEGDKGCSVRGVAVKRRRDASPHRGWPRPGAVRDEIAEWW